MSRWCYSIWQISPPLLPASGFSQLTAFGKRRIVRYNGENVPNEYSAAGPLASANKRIRQHFGSRNYIGLGAELNLALTSARGANPAHDARWFTTQLLTTPLSP